ncbi:MAG TPA: hypothetical protein VIT42_12560 [Microlunatus sp.]
MLRYSRDVAEADWIVRARIPWMQLVGFGPPGFPAYARLRYISDPVGPGRTEADANVAEDHPSDLEQAQRALDHLARFTSTPGHCYFCVWEGFSSEYVPPAGMDRDLVAITPRMPYRRYFLLRGSLADLGGWAETLGVDGYAAPPAFAWPADHRWCFASDVDPHWAGIGAEEPAIASLLEAAELDVVLARPAESQPAYSGG